MSPGIYGKMIKSASGKSASGKTASGKTAQILRSVLFLRAFRRALLAIIPLLSSLSHAGLALDSTTPTDAIAPQETQPSTSPVLDEIRTTGILNVAIANHAIPLSFRYPDGRLDGYCLDVIDEIAEAVTVQLGLNRHPLINIVTSELDTRFELVRSGTVQLECGPNTIQAIEGVTFSEPFLVTGIQFISVISEREAEPPFSPQDTQAAIELGALRNSATAAILADRYPNATIETFVGSRGIRRGIEALQGRLNAFATDSLLLIGELAVAGRSLEDYRLSPTEPLACSPYGVILPRHDRAWIDLVNRVIVSDRGADLWDNWFSSIDRYLQTAEEFCEIEVIPAQAIRAERDRR